MEILESTETILENAILETTLPPTEKPKKTRAPRGSKQKEPKEPKPRGRPKKVKGEPEEIPETPTPQNSEEDDEIIMDEEPVVMEEDFLKEMTRDFYNEEEEVMAALKEFETKKAAPPKPVLQKQPKQKPIEDDLYSSSSPTEILGKQKRVLLAKVRQWKQLFPEQLKGFKIKPNANEKELQQYIDEMDAIINTSNIDTFLTDGILQSLEVIEGVSARTKNYNISGMAAMLKANPKFHNLTKQLYLKYHCFSQVPPEYQLALLMITTAYICKMKNKQAFDIETYLNQPMPQPAKI